MFSRNIHDDRIAMKRNIAFFVSLTFCLALQALTDGPWSFTVADGEATLTGYSGTGPEDFVLPSSVESDGVSYPVTAVGSSAFSGKNWIKSILVPASVTNIANSAFHDCTNLRVVTLSTNLLSIGSSAFRNTRLSTVDIPDSVKNMGEWAFGGCNAMTNAVIGSGLEALPNYAFGYCNAFQSIEIPSTLTNISNSAFSNCKALREVVWNTDAETLNGDIFGGQTNWVSLVIAGNGSTTVGVSALLDNAFSGCSQLKTFEIADDGSLGNIGASAFSRAVSLKSIAIPGSVTNIGSSAFWVCEAMTNATIGAGVETIRPNAFEYCSALARVEIPSSVSGTATTERSTATSSAARRTGCRSSSSATAARR